MWTRSAWGMTSPNSNTPILSQRVNRHIRHLAISCVLKHFGYSQRKHCYKGFQLCTFSFQVWMFLLFMCVYALCMCLCLQRPEGTKSFRMELWTAVCPIHGGCFCKASKCSVTNMSQPLLGHSKLHIWLALFLCNRIAPEAADPAVQVSSSFHTIVYYSR